MLGMSGSQVVNSFLGFSRRRGRTTRWTASNAALFRLDIATEVVLAGCA
jgi:hypothetical protein